MAPTVAQGYPGQNATSATANVTIQAGSNITLTGLLPSPVGTLTVSGTLNIGNATITVTGATTVSGTINATVNGGAKVFGGLLTINTGATWNNSGNSTITIRGVLPIMELLMQGQEYILLTLIPSH